jgi:hypothetical protein
MIHAAEMNSFPAIVSFRRFKSWQTGTTARSKTLIIISYFILGDSDKGSIRY